MLFYCYIPRNSSACYGDTEQIRLPRANWEGCFKINFERKWDNNERRSCKRTMGKAI